jgi:hypothetical protein
MIVGPLDVEPLHLDVDFDALGDNHGGERICRKERWALS